MRKNLIGQGRAKSVEGEEGKDVDTIRVLDWTESQRQDVWACLEVGVAIKTVSK